MPVIFTVPVPPLVKEPFITHPVAELALIVKLLVKVPLILTVQVPVPTVMMPLLIRL